MNEVMELIRHRKTTEINSPITYQKVVSSVHQVSSEEIARTSKTLKMITDYLHSKKLKTSSN
ncbi:MAG: hypothetical protein WCH41_07825 [Methylophilaceae bacterium]|jgi:hypothetical protein